MKIIKRLLPIFAIVLIFLAAFIAGSFSHRDQSDAREVIRSELDRLKDLDSKTTQKYISYKEMFPDATENTELSDEIKDGIHESDTQKNGKFFLGGGSGVPNRKEQ